MKNHIKQGEQSVLHFVIPREKKGLYVKASRARGAKLVDWVTGHLDRCAREDIEADEVVREDWDNRFNR